MRDRYLKAYRRMRRAGADPRRADPRYAKPIVLTVPQAATMAAVLLVTGIALTVTGFAAVGPRAATPADIRLVAVIRSAMPDIDAMSQDDIVTRLTVPRQLNLLLAPLAVTDLVRPPVTSPGWLDSFRGGPAPVTSPDRMQTLGEIASALAPLPTGERADQIDTIVALYRATRDPMSRAIVASVGALPHQQRDRLAGTPSLQPILTALATLPPTVLNDIGSHPDRLRLAVSIAGISDLPDAQLTDLSAGLSDKVLRSVVLYIIDQVRSGNQEPLRLLTAYWGQTQRQPTIPLYPPAKRPRHAR